MDATATLETSTTMAMMPTSVAVCPIQIVVPGNVWSQGGEPTVANGHEPVFWELMTRAAPPSTMPATERTKATFRKFIPSTQPVLLTIDSFVTITNESSDATPLRQGEAG